MTKKDLENKVLDRIKKGKVKPIAKWEFVLKRVFVWILFLLSVLFGALAVSVIIFLLRVNDWEFYEHISGTLPVFILKTFPYFWLLMLGLLAGAAYFNFRNTGKGYKYHFSAVMFLSVFFSVVLGFGLFKTGVAKPIEHLFLNKMPFYQHMNFDKEGLWLNPEDGLLAGEIIEKLGPDELLLIDFSGENWIIIDIADAKVRQEMLLEGNIIRVFGEMLDENIFKAKKIAPWEANFKDLNDKNRKFLKENFMHLRST